MLRNEWRSLSFLTLMWTNSACEEQSGCVYTSILLGKPLSEMKYQQKFWQENKVQSGKACLSTESPDPSSKDGIRLVPNYWSSLFNNALKTQQKLSCIVPLLNAKRICPTRVRFREGWEWVQFPVAMAWAENLCSCGRSQLNGKGACWLSMHLHHGMHLCISGVFRIWY